MRFRNNSQVTIPALDGTVSPITRDFYRLPTVRVAEELLGAFVLRWLPNGKAVGGFVVETEAYLHDDPACHAFAGLNKTNKTLFGEPGHAYIYRSYGLHMMLNVVCADSGCGDGVLIRALEPALGIDEMQIHRSVTSEVNLANGPGKLGQALALSVRCDDGIDVTLATSKLQIVRTGVPRFKVGQSGRIGLTRGQDSQFRFYVLDNPYVSRKSR